MNRTTVIMKPLFSLQTWSPKAKAITPRTIPEYQQTLSYGFLSGNGFLRKQYIPGRKYTIIARTTGKKRRKRAAKPTAFALLGIDSKEAPRYA